MAVPPRRRGPHRRCEGSNLLTQPMTRSRTSRRSVAGTSRGSFGSLLPCWPNMTLRPAAFCFASFSPSCFPASRSADEGRCADEPTQGVEGVGDQPVVGPLAALLAG
jgi:hypothetical protein